MLLIIFVSLLVFHRNVFSLTQRWSLYTIDAARWNKTTGTRTANFSFELTASPLYESRIGFLIYKIKE